MIIYHQGDKRTFEYGLDNEPPIMVYGIEIGVIEDNNHTGIFFVLHPDKKNVFEIGSLMIPFESLFKWYIIDNDVVKEIYEESEELGNLGIIY